MRKVTTTANLVGKVVAAGEEVTFNQVVDPTIEVLRARDVEIVARGVVGDERFVRLAESDGGVV